VGIGACSDGAKDADPGVTIDATGQSTQATEWVGLHTEVPLVPEDFHPLAAGLFGELAHANNFVGERQIGQGIFIGAAADTTTPDQSVVTVSFDEAGGGARHTLAVAPASFEIGGIFIAVVDAALAKMKADVAAKPGSGESFYLEYRVTSANGGRLSFGVRADRGVYSLVLDISTRRTSLDQDKIGMAADTSEPFDTVAGTVSFHMSKDDFDYFSDHAYGTGSVGRQNFTDFALVPHEWLRLNVDPHLDKKFVNVGFELLGLDGKRIPIAKAPASILAGKVFQTLVDRNMTSMLVEEAAAKGSSTPWRVPFYYDAPVGGGVVQVIAEGSQGIFDVAYAVESPRHTLKDVAFLEYEPVDIPDEDPLAEATCDKLGDPSIVLADKGTLDITFKASDVLKKSPDLKVPLKGTIYCSIYAAKDVTVTGPRPDVVSIQDFTLDADLGAEPAPTFVSQVLHAGEYQLLCAQDLNGSGGADPGDPVTLPIGSFPVACNVNPSTVEFALLYPKDQ
jgi:hypothetical protein